MIRRIALISLMILVQFLGIVSSPFSHAGEVTVFAAASLKNAIDDLAELYAKETGHRVFVSLAGSSVLARQIEYGARADVYFSANPTWMDYLEKRDLIDPATRFDLLGNRIVLISPKGFEPLAQPVNAADVLHLLGDGKLAMALVDAVPAGQYGKEAFQALGVWKQLRPSVAEVDNVRAALALVALGEVSLGVVYETDARASENVDIVGLFPSEVDPVIVYPVAAVSGGNTKMTKDFLEFVSSQLAKEVFEAQGFAVLREPKS
ncbi:molybdate ABC transporter substrate-binding protein [Pseudopelagicola sp. nBUS_19]|uniref:molybdate ABC transporter substrate-binding protein n=1 Tax=Pseudopelagicola sp. nBUS_19 TaxID=3395316 RepID=UPI003EBB22FA